MALDEILRSPPVRALIALLLVAVLVPSLPAGAGVAEAVPLRALVGALPMHAPAPAMATGIGPGSHLIMDIPNEGTFACTANFLWADGPKLYLGAAGHCFGPAMDFTTHGSGTRYDASGVDVYVCVSACNFGGQLGFISDGNTVLLGSVAYARSYGIGQDFGVVEIPAALVAQARPELPVWGGPVSATPAKAVGPLCLYGNAMVLGETWPTMARMGAGTYELEGDSFSAYLPSTFGDSGSAVVTCGPDGTGIHGDRPVGVLTHGVPGLTYGTTIPQAQRLAATAGLSLTLIAAS